MTQIQITEGAELYRKYSLGSLDFATALAIVKQDGSHRMLRTGWEGSWREIGWQTPSEHSDMTMPYLFIDYPADHPVTPGARYPWSPTPADLAANDWIALCDISEGRKDL